MDGTTSPAMVQALAHDSIARDSEDSSEKARKKLRQFLSKNESHQVMRTGAVPRALREIAEEFSTSRTALVSGVLDALLLCTTYAFKATQTPAVVFHPEELAQDNGCSRRSILEVMCDLERCGYLVREKSDAPDGYTGVMLTLEALRDPNTYWVLKTKGRRVSGFVDWLDSVQLVSNERPRKVARSPYNIEVIKPPAVEKTSTEIDTLGKNETSGANASGNESGSFWAQFVSRSVRDAKLRGKVSQARLKEFGLRVKTLKLQVAEVQRYVDFKIWEVTDVRQESYSAQTMVAILTADLVHHRAVTKNLEALKRREIRRQIAEAREERARQAQHERDEAKREAERLRMQIPPPPLEDWQHALKERVPDKSWTNFLSKLGRQSSSEFRCFNTFTAAWISDHFEKELLDVVGPCTILTPDRSFSIEAHESHQEPRSSLEAMDAERTSPEPVESNLSELSGWQRPLFEASNGLDWRLFLSRLKHRGTTETGAIRLCVDDDPFVAQWVSERYAITLYEALGPVCLECTATEKTWRLCG